MATVSDNKKMSTKVNTHVNLSLDELCKFASKYDGFISNDNDTLVVSSGDIKGRLPDDKYVVETKYAKKNVWWKEDGSDNKKLSNNGWDDIKKCLFSSVENKDLFVIDGFYNHVEKHKMAVRLITTETAAAYFFKMIVVKPNKTEIDSFNPQWTLMHSPNTNVDNYVKIGLNSSKAIATNLKSRESIFVGTFCFTEITKNLLSIMSYYLSLSNVGMFYCSAGVNSKNENSMFFGLAGSGKSIMAIDNKKIVTSEAVAWTESKGICSLESGITLKPSSFQRDSDEFKSAINKQCIIENPNFDDDNNIMFYYKKIKDHSNTHITFPRQNFENSVLMANDPSTVIFLVKDILGVLPRVSKLNKGQAIYYFLSGYTSTSTGVEAGVVEPKAEFSSCFAQPFLLLKPTRYAEILRQRLKNSNANIYMINVGWIDGNYKTGRRVPTEETKSVVKYLIDKPDNVKLNFKRQKYFNFKSLTSVEDNDEVFYLKNTWDSKSSYNKKYKSLVKSFVKNYEQFKNDDFADKYNKFGPSL